MKIPALKTLVSVFVFAAFAVGLIDAADKPVAKHLSRLVVVLANDGLKPTIDKDGDIKVELLIDAESKRTQIAFITAQVNPVAGTEYFEAWTIVARSDVPFDATTLRTVLRDAAQRVMPAWKLMTVDGKESIVGYVSLPTDIDGDRFLYTLGVTVGAADRMEKELTNADAY